MKRLFPIMAALFLTACAAYGGSGLKLGEARLDDVIRVMGEPAMRWQDSDGSVQLAYPRGPFGFHTFMVRVGPDGKLQRIGNVLDPSVFAQIRPGMTEAQVMRILGPPYPGWTVYFKARDELVWEWRYCDDWSEAARFNVLFDGTSGAVRSTMSLTESQRGFCSTGRCLCSR
ncbi:MAG TPA: outer membrane protein assembly factor BamE [Sulfuricella sp.]|nr:outer membrane protein assembly factor BamE [Sulfuricella sp.]